MRCNEMMLGHVRVATASELSSVRAVTAAAYDQYRPLFAPEVFELYLDDLLDLGARADVSELLVYETSGAIVGAVSFFPDAAAEDLGWPAGWSGLRALAVDPARRGTGAGRALMEACRERAVAAGAEVLCLHTADFMTAAVALYGSLGYRRVPEFDLYAGDVLDLDRADLPQVIAYRLDL